MGNCVNRKESDTMAKYYCILFDIDNTLLDFDMAEQKALAQTLQESNIPASHEITESYRQINEALWQQLEQRKIHRDQIATERFSRFLKENKLPGDAIEMSNLYRKNLGMQSHLMPNALEVCKELAEVATLAVISNGFTDIQVPRLAASGLAQFMEDTFISQALGIDKPNREIFDLALDLLGIEQRANVLVVGDRLESDILGGQNAGIATCWYRANGEENHTGIQPTYEISDLTDLYKIVMEADELERVGIRNRKHSI